MSRRRRLDGLERELPPRDRVIAWMTEAQTFRTIPAYLDWLLGQPDTEHPLASVLGPRAWAPRSGGRAGARGPGPDPATEAQFLYTLVVELNRRVGEELAFSREVGERLLWQHLFLVATGVFTFETRASAVAEDRFDEFVAWAADVEAHLVGLVGLERASRSIASRYLNGHEVLWPASLEDLVSMLTAAREWHRIVIDAGPPADVDRDVEAIDARAEDVASHLVRSIVEWARIEVLTGQGHRAPAIARVRRLLEPGRPGPGAPPADRLRAASPPPPGRRPTATRRRATPRPGRTAGGKT